MTCGLSEEERRERLTAEHGEARILPGAASAPALRLIGKRLGVHPNDVAVCAYRDRAAAEAWRASGSAHGQPTLGIAEQDGEVIAVIDLRPQFAADCRAPVPPSFPDDWKKFGRKLGQRFRWVADDEGCRVPECDACGARIVSGVMMHTGACREVGLM